jgi:Zn-dependent peptidase ImmA (M78 family)
LVFTFPLGRDGVRGFSVWNERGPLAAVNTWWRVEARIYTLFHEFGHLLTRTSSACVEVGRKFARPSDSVERWCEEFSAAIVLPRDAVEKFLLREFGRPTAPIDDLAIPSKIANRFRVSLRAATLRLIELHLASWDLYAEIPPLSENKPSGGGGSGRDRGEIRKDQFGDRAVRLMIRALGRDVLGRTDVLDALDISDTDLSKLERRVARSA